MDFLFTRPLRNRFPWLATCNRRGFGKQHFSRVEDACAGIASRGRDRPGLGFVSDLGRRMGQNRDLNNCLKPPFKWIRQVPQSFSLSGSFSELDSNVLNRELLFTVFCTNTLG